jgi:hypothetical protein
MRCTYPISVALVLSLDGGSIQAQRILSKTIQRAADGSSRIVLIFGWDSSPGSVAAPIPGVPYSGVQVDERVQASASGARISQSTSK